MEVSIFVCVCGGGPSNVAGREREGNVHCVQCRDPGMVRRGPRPWHALPPQPLASLMALLSSDGLRDGNGGPRTCLICLVLTCSSLPARDPELVEGNSSKCHGWNNVASDMHLILCLAVVLEREQDEVYKLSND